MAETEGDDTVTIEEFAEAVDEQIRQAEEVLGGDDGDNCTYSQGYLPRQAVFSCLTCTRGSMAGFCYACSVHCHDGHEVVELWTRRSFRCDCGNTKYNGTSCKLQPEKDAENLNNVYNQNFEGLYCTCRRPYPDPEREEEESMLQCCICEDWFHTEHLHLPENLANLDDHEIICDTCASAERCGFCAAYCAVEVEVEGGAVVNSVDEAGAGTGGAGGVEGVDGPLPVLTDGGGKPLDLGGDSSCVTVELALKDGTAVKIEGKIEGEATIKREPENGGEAKSGVAAKIGVKTENGAEVRDRVELKSAGVEAKSGVKAENGVEPEQGVELRLPTDRLAGEAKVEAKAEPEGDARASGCKLAGPVASMGGGRALALPKGWRDHLCRCVDCVALYGERKCAFLLQEDDKMEVYASKAKDKPSMTERAEAAFQEGLSRGQQVELLHGFNHMAEELKSFLRPFGQSGVPVTATDVTTFFDGLKQKKQRIV